MLNSPTTVMVSDSDTVLNAGASPDTSHR